MDGSPISTFGLQLPAFMNTFDDYLESLLRILGGGEPLAKVIRVGSDINFAKNTLASASTAAMTTSLGSASDAISAVLLSAVAGGAEGSSTIN
ncbi:hypothetical protein BGZ76_006671 [Entomortierella beljakovae]|nr:hypothetical protein BGZ76_006671 [Entomortierella beljakovae]